MVSINNYWRGHIMSDYFVYDGLEKLGIAEYKGDGFHLIKTDGFEHLTDNIELWAVEHGYTLFNTYNGIFPVPVDFATFNYSV